MDKVFQNEDGDCAGKSAGHESEANEQDYAGFPGYAVAGVGIRVG